MPPLTITIEIMRNSFPVHLRHFIPNNDIRSILLLLMCCAACTFRYSVSSM